MGKTISFERVKKIALEDVDFILRTREVPVEAPANCPSAMAKLTKTLKEFIRGLDVSCIGELLELIPKGLDSRLPEWLYGPVEAQLGEDGWELVPAARYVSPTRKKNNMNERTTYKRSYEVVTPMFDFELPRQGKPMNTRTRKMVWKEHRRLANAPRSVRKRVLKRV